MSLLPFADAKAKLLAAARPLAATENLDLADATGRVLAEDLRSAIDVPGFDNTAMDGYALAAADAPTAGARLPVSQRIAAGDFPAPLAAGSAARIFTGAPLPPGADCVVMQEGCREADGAVTIDSPPVAGQHVRRAGSDIARGSVALPAGTRLSAAALGLAASIGIARVTVRRRLKVAIFFTGSELVMPGQALAPGRIYNSNRYVIRGFLQQAGAEVIDLGIVRDDREATRAALREAARDADLILSSGGMSEGEEDHVKPALAAEGRVDVWKIAAKPGKPLAFGEVRRDRDAVPFIGLPGNPVSVWANLVTLVRPFLRAMEGDRALEPPLLRLRADFAYTVGGNRLEWVRVRCNQSGGLDLYHTQDSAVLSSAVWAHGLAPLPAGATVRPGDLVDFLPGPPR
jgi:molybdopterin molybdotransferase